MSYKNGKNLLPEFLLLQIQEYVQGEIIYIPRKEPGRTGWGEANGAKQEFRSRNEEIRKLSQSGIKIRELAEQYHLSEHSIRKILHHREEPEESLTCVAY
ncbi:MAG TPA: CD3324 family protein [Bacillota bacterium]|nr:CD3324 family protein [Bacillota bacterium]